MNPAEEENEKQDALCVLDKDCRFVFVNQTMADLYDISPEGHAGRSVSEIVPKMTEITEFAVREVLRTQEPLILSLVGQLLPTTDSTRHWVVCYLPVADGTEVGVVGTQMEHGLEASPREL